MDDEHLYNMLGEAHLGRDHEILLNMIFKKINEEQQTDEKNTVSAAVAAIDYGNNDVDNVEELGARGGGDILNETFFETPKRRIRRTRQKTRIDGKIFVICLVYASRLNSFINKLLISL